MSRVPQIFLSSTFFDLQQVRADIADFVERDLGYRLLASEHRSFPVDPSVDTIENCRRKVQDDADILVLVVGGRYGSIPASVGKSVTNLEYVTARAKGIPIFAFVHRDVLALLPIAEKNPTADFTGTVDSPRLFDFVREVRTADRVWTFPFELAQDIVATLRLQLAYETSRGLSLSLRARQLPPALSDLRGRSFQIAVEQPEAWEAKLFAQVLADGVNAHAEQRRAHQLGIIRGAGDIVNEAEASEFLSAAIRDGQQVADGMQQVVDYVVNEGFAKEDVCAIVHGANDMARTYKHVLDWAARLRNANVPDQWRALALAASRLLDNFLREAEEFGPRTQLAIEKILSAGVDGPQKLKLKFEYNVPESQEIKDETARLRRRYGA